MSAITEHSIRSLCKRRLQKQFAHDDSTLIVEELGIVGGRRRIDIAAINGHLHGFEIKSDLDNLNRLAGQAAEYNNVFDYMTVLCSEKYTNGALEIIPQFWGILEVYNNRTGSTSGRWHRRPRINRFIDLELRFHLLWRDEMISVLSSHSAPAFILRSSKNVMAKYASAHLPNKALSSAVRASLKAREGWRGPPPS